jgi:hypothetical protein
MTSKHTVVMNDNSHGHVDITVYLTSWFIFNLRKINNNQHRVLVSLIQGWCYDM